MRVTIVGLGRFGGGIGAARYFAQRGDIVTVTDLCQEAELADSIAALEDLPIRYILGGHDDPVLLDTDLIVASPAVPFDAPILRGARRKHRRITTELAVFCEQAAAPLLFVTGSNGKTTTATLLHSMLDAAGLSPRLAGNIGISLLPEVDRLMPEAPIVVEVSSFQAEYLDAHRVQARGAIITNVTPNHLDRHDTFEAYASAKEKIARLVEPGGPVFIGEPTPANFLLDIGHARRIAAPNLNAATLGQTMGLGFQRRNLEAAFALANACFSVVTIDHAESVATAFGGLAHRLEDVADVCGVKFVNDSKSTTPAATLAALESIDAPIHLIMGGRDKGLDTTSLLQAASACRSVTLIGEMAEDLSRKLPAGGIVDGLPKAVSRLARTARAGDVVLLSPGFPSYGDFKDYRHRGRVFREAVLEIGSESPDSLNRTS